MTACAQETPAADTTGRTRLLYWPGGLSTGILNKAKSQFDSRTEIAPELLQGDYREQLVAILNSGQDRPGIVGIKGEEVASLVPRADLFVDLHTLGVDDLMSEYVPWKWQQAASPDNRQIGFPIDIGPTATFYRADLFARAGLPSEPAEMATVVRTWADYIANGVKLVKATPSVKLVRNGSELYTIKLWQGTQRYIDETNHYIGGEPHVRAAWDLAVDLIGKDLSAGILGDDESGWAEAMKKGTVATALGASWLGYDLTSLAPDTSGKWRVAAGPAIGANYGGSFLAIPEGSADPELSFEIIKWILAPDNQAAAFTDAALFPAATAAFDMPALQEPDPFFGGQKTIEIFAESARKAHRVYEAPADSKIHEVFVDQLSEIELGTKAATRAWTDAVAAGRSIGESLGVN
ncbi:ABC transporter substrate-binding protein [Actinoplanes derwentensis]|uniref:Cellobiose transport system substrate-binding protein n=1 Tax=Actinoplanes derwentensis TaxID=113562 RepID=A0A1H1YE29_9ACTN|nr:extracellular solute-binding protein [Actinoplanes derwentensis]GID81107.1 sugar ABC transporter substrate-binding protein [Actinoplanes derwentensis]SDT19641.1 cellobiose transport system substrate-binding protein [Actinoplanes derwentensis]